MAVHTHRITVESKGNTHILDLTERVAHFVEVSATRQGIVTVFVIGSTAAISTTEFEPGLVKSDFRTAFERIAPEEGDYEHEKTWHDDNGHSHVRATLTGPSLTVPIVDGRMTLGTWQQIVLMDFDTRPRRREVVVQILGE